jgi:hypothetical protein
VHETAILQLQLQYSSKKWHTGREFPPADGSAGTGVEGASAEGADHLTAMTVPPFPPHSRCRDPTTTPASGSQQAGRHGRSSPPPTSPPQGAAPLPPTHRRSTVEVDDRLPSHPYALIRRGLDATAASRFVRLLGRLLFHFPQRRQRAIC